MTKRQTKSKEKIQAALIQLLAEKSFDKISVADLTKTAQINRGTFYLHYLDKYDLIDQLAARIKQDLADILSHPLPHNQAYLQEAMTYLQTHRDLVQTMKTLPNLDFRREMTNFISDMIDRFPDFSDRVDHFQDFPVPYARSSFISMIVQILLTWMDQDMTQAPQDIGLMISQLENLL